MGGLCPCSIGTSQPRTLPHVTWLHVPKAGTSFGTTVIHFGCTLPDSVKPHCNSTVYKSACVSQLNAVFEEYPFAQHCNRSVLDERRIDGHQPPQWPKDSGSVVAMLREPTQRLVSSWRFWSALRLYNSRHSNSNSTREQTSLDAYAARFYAKGCAATMIAGGHCGVHTTLSEAAAEALKHEAARRLRDDFAFVGLVEHWNLSICLFHAMHGGRVIPAEFENSRPTHLALAPTHGAPTPALRRQRDLRSASEPEQPSSRQLHVGVTAPGEERPSSHALSPPTTSTPHVPGHGTGLGAAGSPKVNYSDTIDEFVYQAAVDRFVRDLSRFGLSMDGGKAHACERGRVPKFS